MNKVAIPSILAATVLVAGIFAFMPVEKASTVHTTIQGTQFTRSDFALKATTDTDVRCGSESAYQVFISMTNVVATPELLRVTFTDTDFIEFEVGPDDTITIVQSAGGTQTADGTVQVGAGTGSVAADWQGWISLLTESDASPPNAAPFNNANFCVTT